MNKRENLINNLNIIINESIAEDDGNVIKSLVKDSPEG
jgi:hypothetical protein